VVTGRNGVRMVGAVGWARSLGQEVAEQRHVVGDGIDEAGLAQDSGGVVGGEEVGAVRVGMDMP
jgi:hypothetical protein